MDRSQTITVKLMAYQGRALHTLLLESVEEADGVERQVLEQAEEKLGDANVLATWLRELVTVEWTLDEFAGVMARLTPQLLTSRPELQTTRRNLEREGSRTSIAC